MSLGFEDLPIFRFYGITANAIVNYNKIICIINPLFEEKCLFITSII